VRKLEVVVNEKGEIVGILATEEEKEELVKEIVKEIVMKPENGKGENSS